MDLPPIAGWPTEYPELDPSRSLYIVYEDLLDLKANHHLVASGSWLSKFGQNLLELETELDHFYHSRDFAHDLLKIHNWIKNAKQKGISLTNALFEAKKHDFKDLKLLKSFAHELVEHDTIGLDQLLKDCQKFLRKKNFLTSN
jgi:predicted glycosyltransferase involved in capsule biosynthesis